MWTIILIGLGVGTLAMGVFTIILMVAARKQERENKYWSYKTTKIWTRK